MNDLWHANGGMVNPAIEKRLCSAGVTCIHLSASQKNAGWKAMKMNQKQNFDQILESAVVASWADLMRGAQSGLIHIEYGFAPSGTLDYLQVWSSIKRGHWLLACAFRMSPSELHNIGVHFDNGYESEGLAQILECVITHQNAFALPRNLGRAGLLQISTPTQKEIAAAAASVNDAFDYIHFAPAELALA